MWRFLTCYRSAHSAQLCACAAEKYLREIWPVVTKALKEAGLGCELNLVCSMCPLLVVHEQRTLLSSACAGGGLDDGEDHAQDVGPLRDH